MPIEAEIMETALELQAEGVPDFHGFMLARKMRDRTGARRLTAHGTLYKALARMQRLGWLSSRWEDPVIASREGRPFRRLYTVASAGVQALARYRKTKSVAPLSLASERAASA